MYFALLPLSLVHNSILVIFPTHLEALRQMLCGCPQDKRTFALFSNCELFLTA